MEYWTSTDSVYGSRHVSAYWDNTTYTVPDGLPFCQTEETNEMQRMDMLFLIDLVGSPEPDFTAFTVR